ncbi:MAG: hypothetical protein QGG23_07705 [Candidatus Bathyarchaeota archaeon]|nr:hypothetical protein [Candidatus Bathyarchaeota archaeon]
MNLVDMLSILTGAFLVSITHAILPDHWLPLILISRAEKWSPKDTFWAATLIIIPHLVSTILLGLLMGIIGFKLSVSNEVLMEVVTPVMFIFLGLVYIYRNYRADGHHHGVDISNLNDRSKGRVITIMATALFFSPCIPMGSYFLIAGADGIGILTLVAIIHVVATLGGILTMVALGRRGIETMKWNFLKHNENLITGLILIVLAFFVFFFEV